MDGPDANVIPFLAKLEDWVEKDTPPDDLSAVRLIPEASIMQHDLGGTISFARPVCEYGKFPKYNGRGNPNLSGSFDCVES